MHDDPLAAFLHFGYLPGPSGPVRAGDTDPDGEATPALLGEVLAARASAGPEAPTADDEETLTRSGVAALHSCFSAPGPGPHVVPLSGGLDSRAILAGLVAAGLGDEVVAVTVGTPGTFDYEIARRVAEAAGVAHEAIDLTRIELEAAALERALVDSDTTSWAFDVYFHRLIPARFGSDATYWSGFMGGELAGSHVGVEADASWPAVARRFAAHARFCRDEALTSPSFAADRMLPARPWCPPDVVSYGDQLDFGVRQHSYVRPTVLVAGFDYRAPFLTPRWLRFMLGVPAAHRRGERLFKRILMAAFPALFSLPTKNSAGLSLGAHPALVTARIRQLKVAATFRSRGAIRRAVRERRLPVPFPMLNYLDFPAALRSRADVRILISELVQALDDRGAVGWVSGSRLWAEHERAGGDFDLACALTLLASLELNLRADAARSRPRFRQER